MKLKIRFFTFIFLALSLSLILQGCSKPSKIYEKFQVIDKAHKENRSLCTLPVDKLNQREAVFIGSIYLEKGNLSKETKEHLHSIANISLECSSYIVMVAHYSSEEDKDRHQYVHNLYDNIISYFDKYYGVRSSLVPIDCYNERTPVFYSSNTNLKNTVDNANKDRVDFFASYYVRDLYVHACKL